MRIEGKCPRGELIRNGLVALMILVFSGWLFKDGYYKYPQENLRHAIENLPVGWPKVPEEVKWPTINRKVTKEGVAFIRKDMKVDEVTAALGEPGLKHGQELRYFGPAGFLVVKILGEQVRSGDFFESKEKTEWEIRTQKVLGVGFLILGLVIAIRFLRMVLMRTVLTDDGLSLTGTSPITWDEMSALDDSEYRRKAWVYLQHKQGGTSKRVKLDSYRIDKFREIIGEICDRKGFPKPFVKRKAEKPTDGADPEAGDDGKAGTD